MAAHGQLPDFCLVGEPTNPERLGEVIKIGRRGSLNARISVRGRQGHVAYPQRADNPVHRLIAALNEMLGRPLDQGSDWFEPSSLQVTSIDVGNPAANVIPAEARAALNIRFNDRHSSASLVAWLREVLARHAPNADLALADQRRIFLTRSGAAGRGAVGGDRARDGDCASPRYRRRHVRRPVHRAPLRGRGIRPGRRDHAPVDERVPVADLLMLTDIYEAVIAAFLR